MDVFSMVYWIVGLGVAAIVMLIFYYIIVAAVKNGIIEANKVIEKTKLEARLAELKEKQNTNTKM